MRVQVQFWSVRDWCFNIFNARLYQTKHDVPSRRKREKRTWTRLINRFRFGLGFKLSKRWNVMYNPMTHTMTHNRSSTEKRGYMIPCGPTDPASFINNIQTSRLR